MNSWKIKSQFLKDFRNLTSPYWKSEDRWKAIGLLTAIIAMNLGMVYVQVG